VEKEAGQGGLRERLRSRRWDVREAAVDEAKRLGAEGDTLLSDLLVEQPRADVAAVLGDLQGNSGAVALRSVLAVTGSGSRDIRCAALLSLAKRCGEDATPDLVAALTSRDGTVKDYAVIGLAGAGDGRAWSQVFERLGLLLGRESRQLGQSAVLVAVAYLVQHLDGDGGHRGVLVDLLRKRWHRMNDEELVWFSDFWPDAGPQGPPPALVAIPEPDRVRAWVRHPLFDPLES
jgi:hypothetical protein